MQVDTTVWLALYSSLPGVCRQSKDYASTAIAYFTVCLASYIYFGLLYLYSGLSNPFGDDPCDFPITAYQASSPAPPQFSSA